MSKNLDSALSISLIRWTVGTPERKEPPITFTQTEIDYMKNHYDIYCNKSVDFSTRIVGKIRLRRFKKFYPKYDELSDDIKDQIENDHHYFLVPKDTSSQRLYISNDDFAIPPCPPFCSTGKT